MRESRFYDLIGIHSCDSIEELEAHVKLMHGIDLCCDQEVDACYLGSDDHWVSSMDARMSWRSNNLCLPDADVFSITNMFMAAVRLFRFSNAVVLLPGWYRTVMPFRRDDAVVFSSLEPNRTHDRNDERFAAEALFSLGEEYFVDRYRTNLQRMKYVAGSRGIKLMVATSDPSNAAVLERSGCEGWP